jgi:hypothetical protein
MSPIIELQRRQVEAGRIRAGDRSNGRPNKLAEWRLTSKDRDRLEAAGQLWGGTVRAWKDHEGEFELYTTTASLPIMFLPGQVPSTWYELWSKGGCQRRCDGEHEMIGDTSCLCGEERECKPTTRLSVLLPDLPGVGSWLLSSTGWNAAAELAGAAELLGRATAQGVLVPARLRLEQRVSVKAGQTRRFAVPVIDVDVSLRELIGAMPESRQISESSSTASGAGNVTWTSVGETTWTPIVSGANTATLGEAIAATEELEPHRGPKSPPPIPVVDDDIFAGEPVPIPDEDELPVVEHEDDPTKRTGPQTRKLNVLVGTLREAGHITNDQLWRAIAKERQVDVETMIEIFGGRDAEGELHWSPLRESLDKGEASGLIDRLEKHEGSVRDDGA